MMVGIGKVNSNFNTYAAYGDDTYGMMQVYDTLTIKNAKGEVMPSVASWEVSRTALSTPLLLGTMLSSPMARLSPRTMRYLI